MHVVEKEDESRWKGRETGRAITREKLRDEER